MAVGSKDANDLKMVLWERSVDAPGVCRCQGGSGSGGGGVGTRGRCPRMLGGGVCGKVGWGVGGHRGVDRERVSERARELPCSSLVCV